MIGKFKLNRFISAIVVFELMIVVMYIANFLLGRPWTKPTVLVDMDGESSICCWFSVVQSAVVAFLSGIIACDNFSWKKLLSWSLWGFPLVFIMLSMDEMVQIHEWLGSHSDVLLEGQSREGTAFDRTGIWFLILGIPFIAAFMTYIYLLKKYFGNLFNYIYLIAGISIFIGGCVVVEGLNNLFPDTATLGGVLMVALEEFMEMFGITIILWGMLESCVLKSRVPISENG